MKIWTTTTLIIAFFIAIIFSGCSTTAEIAAPKPVKLPTELGRIYKTLDGIDLSHYKRIEDGLLLIGTIGEYDLLLTEPGKPYMLYGNMKGLYARKYSISSYDEVFSSLQVNYYSGYMYRWHENKDNPVPILGRLTTRGKGGYLRVADGSFDFIIFAKQFFSSTPSNQAIMTKGLLTFIDGSGHIVDKRYQLNRYSHLNNPYTPGIFNHEEESTDREVMIDSKANDDREKFIFASGLPQFDFLLPKPEPLLTLLRGKKSWHYIQKYVFFSDVFSLRKLFAQKKINANKLQIPKSFWVIKDRNTYYDGNFMRRFFVPWGESAFVYSYKTNKTYLDSYEPKKGYQPPVLTLPSLKEIVTNGQLSVNQQCMGKSDGMVVLSGQCDPEAPSFPLTVMTELSNYQFIINVWSSVNHRSVYLLTGVESPEKKFYHWIVDAFMVNKIVKPTATMAILTTGKDSFSDKLIAFANQGEEKQICEKQALAVSNAEKALQIKLRINSSLKNYERNYQRDWANFPRAVDQFIRNSHHSTPTRDFEHDVWNDLSEKKQNVKQHLDMIKRYQNVNNSVCQPNSERMTQLVSALDTFYKDLSSSMKQLSDTYYIKAIDYTKKIRNMAYRIEAAKKQYNQQMAISQFMNNLKSSMQSDLATKRATAFSIANSMRESREDVNAQIADAKARNQAYFANKTPVVITQTGIISPVSLPSQTLDISSKSTVYLAHKKTNRLGLKDAMAQAEAKTKKLRRKAQKNRILNNKPADLSKQEAEKIVYTVALTWQNKVGIWFACGPVQCTQAGDDTEKAALNFVVGNKSIIGKNKYHRCNQYTLSSMAKDTAGDFSEKRIRRLSKCLVKE